LHHHHKEKSVLLRAKAPLRISFAGGGTDVPPFPQTEGGLVLSATIDRYAYSSLRSRDDGQISIQSVDYKMSVDMDVNEPVMFDGKLDLVKAAIGRLGSDEQGGYDLFLHSSAPPGSGLGSSSTVMVALVGLLRDRYGLALDDYQVASLAHSIERNELGIKGGMQDQYAAAFGGFNLIEFEKERVIVNPLRIPEATVHELEHNMMLCYTGITRASSQIIDDQTKRVESGNADSLAALRAQKDLAVAMKNALLTGRLSEFGSLLDEAWQQKKKMSAKIANPLINDVYEIARKNGALGGKVTGAGGGGYILLYCQFEKKYDVAEALQNMGVKVDEFAFEQRGLTTWRIAE
jgi:D-glycero-alpha-D-manno-heptose-7-phosphate kinase